MTLRFYMYLQPYQTLVVNCIFGGSKGYAAVSSHKKTILSISRTENKRNRS
jgi:phage terminase large subunit-like protein